MRIHFLSDLHAEFADFDIPDVDADVTVLAGDIHTRDRGVSIARRFSQQRPVVYVAGNHEFYGTAIPKLYGKIKSQVADSTISFLQSETTVVGDCRFIGATLWTDYGLFGDDKRELGIDVGKSTMNDFKQIRTNPGFRKLSPAFLYAACRQTIAYIESVLAEKHDGPTIVVTHHAPSIQSIAPEHRNDPLSASYASNLENLILASKIDVWFHGHTHTCANYRIGGTRVISNQRGYPGECPSEFDAGLIITV